MLPASSVARTWKVCAPSPRPVSVCGEAHAANAPASSAHSKLVPPSADEKAKVAPVALVSAPGPESTVAVGAVVSTVQVGRVGAGVAGGVGRADVEDVRALGDRDRLG